MDKYSAIVKIDGLRQVYSVTLDQYVEVFHLNVLVGLEGDKPPDLQMHVDRFPPREIGKVYLLRARKQPGHLNHVGVMTASFWAKAIDEVDEKSAAEVLGYVHRVLRSEGIRAEEKISRALAAMEVLGWS